MIDRLRASTSTAWAAILIAAGLVGGLTGVLRYAGVIRGWPTLVLCLLAVAAIPTARTLSGRLFANTVLLCGVIYLSWMVPAPGIGTHGGRVLVGLAMLVTGFAVARFLRITDVAFLPEVRGIDVCTLVVVPVAAWGSLQFWFKSNTLELAHGTLAAMWDNTSHYYIVSAMHEWQMITRAMPTPPDGSQNGFIDYPVGYHSVAATLMDLLLGNPSAITGPNAVSFLFVVGVMAIIAYLIVAAGVASLPSVRDAGIWGRLSVGTAVSIMAFGPGFLAQANAQYNFFLAQALVAAAVIAAASSPRVFDRATAATLLSAVLVAGGAWLPLGLLAAVLGAAVFFFPLRREQWRAGWADRVLVGVLALVVLVFTAIPLSWLVVSFTGEVFATATGGVSPVTAFLPQVGVNIAIVVVAVLWLRRQQFADAPDLGRIAAGMAGLVVAIVGYAIIEASIMAGEGQDLPPYYPQKLLNAFVVVLWLLIAMQVGPLVHRLAGRLQPKAAWQTMLAALALAALGLGTFWTAQLPVLGRGGLAPEYLEVLKQPQPREDLTRACAVVAGIPPEQVAIVASAKPVDTLVCASDRLLYTSKVWQVNADTMTKWDVELVEAARAGLEDGSVVLVVDPYAVELFRGLVGPELADRVFAW